MKTRKLTKKKSKEWKKINFSKLKFKNINDIFIYLKKKNILISPWIFDIFKNKKNNFKIPNETIYLYKIKVSDLGFKKTTTLDKIYQKIKKKNYELVNPVVALVARNFYLDQQKGEWLRFATPFKSMVDTDGVPHLPKLGSALGKFFIETYWSYKKAVFHPHNEFIVYFNDKQKT